MFGAMTPRCGSMLRLSSSHAEDVTHAEVGYYLGNVSTKCYKNTIQMSGERKQL